MLHTSLGTHRVRWSVWLAVGVMLGLLLGFAVGLAKPRIRK
jgi:hypothetical protein